MKREFLRGLGLEEETVQKIVDEHHDTLRDFKNKAEKTESLQEQLDKANEELDNRDKQITDLQKAKDGDNQELKDKLANYEKENAQYKADMKELKLNNAVKLAVAKDANDADDILAFINKDELELQDDGNVKGLDKAIESLKESKPYLFAESKPSGRTPNDGKTVNGGITQEEFNNMSVAERTNLFVNDRKTYDTLINN
ncbi:phage scaffolding protein [Staphylococcus epidermidis]|uniref:phage scaffolding protein n=1 Tax=Staphylococcus epidermidis TaxID=1282 RepID=UPI002003A9E3|nr:phage scaffolding protein [Staphylococcus epidermidis]MCG1905369.1 phage scaffolding protein [Staphylococcus epidermidis]MCG2105660.1 phage scaffolding protein [Staphylococcus epidermidis]MCK6118940.1 phage scaffolding protein [Staphylococcus epidermidis]MCK6155941.1 phage scaffolding protein [Staphylococcus epidermidis]